MVVVIDASAPGRVARFRPAWRKCIAMTIRPTSTIGAIGLQATNTIGYYSHLILFGHMVRHMRKRWDVHALEAKLGLQTGPHGGDLGGMAVVEKRDNAVHTSLLSVCSWETVSLASPCIAAMPWPAHVRARPPPVTVRPTRGR